jgi:hypothetical protein
MFFFLFTSFNRLIIFSTRVIVESMGSIARDFIPHHHFVLPTNPSSVCFILADFWFSSAIIDGFFDAGMLRQALNANRAQNEPVERDVIRRNIGRRLRLAEY